MNGHIAIVAAAALVAAAAISSPLSAAEPGFVPDTGQINPGHAAQPWSAAPQLPQDQQPAPQDARAALMMPDNGISSAGPEPTPGPATSSASTSTPAGASALPPGPIGATMQTMPAKFSQRNDLLDHLPVMAWPLPLNDQQRQQIFTTVMADKSSPATDAAALKPASLLSFEQTREMHPLPPTLASIDGLQGLKFVKGKDKVLLIQPSNGIVVDEIAK